MVLDTSLANERVPVCAMDGIGKSIAMVAMMSEPVRSTADANDMSGLMQKHVVDTVACGCAMSQYMCPAVVYMFMYG